MNFQPATPTIVPPTPSPNHNSRVNGGSSSSTRGQSSVSSGSDIFYDAEDSEMQTKRRSMYRAPGTASSPDLATLLRKAKLRESAAAGKDANNRSNRTAQQPLTPNRLRPDDPSQRPSTTNNSFASPSSPRSPLMKGKSRAGGSSAGISSERSPEWGLTSPRSMSNMKEGFKNGKSSVRQKAAAFLNILGGNSNRERSRTITAANMGYSPPKMFSYPPPVPPLPEKTKRHASVTPEMDVFTTPSGSSDLQKPLPKISNEDNDIGPETMDVENSMVMVRPDSRNQSRTPSPTATVTHATVKPNNRRKRRSMSVSDAELKKAMAASFGPSFTPLRASIEEKRSEDSIGWSSALSGFMSDLEGKLDDLDPISASLDLRDPSTLPRRPPERAKSDTATNILRSGQRPPVRTANSSPASVGRSSTPAVTLQPVYGEEESLLNAVLNSPTESSFSPTEAVVPPRSASLQGTPSRARSGSANALPNRSPNVRYGPRSPGARSIGGPIPSPVRETDRLRIPASIHSLQLRTITDTNKR
ncbi:hypothetical protein QCA50_004247 [Cerrena zonata]|uniref:Uncharacterized protein n=1 Tax=Cerrena zonata TaxID=2478898 RepID=A0AAW0GNE8_9APHY